MEDHKRYQEMNTTKIHFYRFIWNNMIACVFMHLDGSKEMDMGEHWFFLSKNHIKRIKNFERELTHTI